MFYKTTTLDRITEVVVVGHNEG